MIRYHKFRQELLGPVPARDVYHRPGKGKGWPEECPPLRTANAFGFDLLANFDLEFVYRPGREASRAKTGSRGAGKPPGAASGWRVKHPIVVESDFGWAPRGGMEAAPLTQEYAWFWQRGQTLPHVITDNVYDVIQHQVKVSTFLYLETDPDEILMLTEIPNLRRPFRAVSAVIETDWFPASYPWHCVLELDPTAGRIRIAKGEPLCRLIPLRRQRYDARPMTHRQFDHFFERGQQWLQTHGKAPPAGASAGTLDITRTYVRQQKRSAFNVHE